MRKVNGLIYVAIAMYTVLLLVSAGCSGSANALSPDELRATADGYVAAITAEVGNNSVVSDDAELPRGTSNPGKDKEFTGTGFKDKKKEMEAAPPELKSYKQTPVVASKPQYQGCQVNADGSVTCGSGAGYVRRGLFGRMRRGW